MKHLCGLRCYGISFTLCCFVVSAHQSHRGCPSPDFPYNGDYTPKTDKFLPGDEVKYFCEAGFVLIGKETSKCKSNKLWSDGTPFCDRSAVLEDPYVSNTSSNSSISHIKDGNNSTCFLWESSTGRDLQVNLKEKAIVTAIRILFDTGTSAKIQIHTGSENNKTLCDDCNIYTGTKEWIVMKCKTSDVLGCSIKIVTEQPTNISICEIEVYVKDENDCEHSPDTRVPFGYFQVNRKKATLKCADGLQDKHGRLSCEENSWTNLGARCDDEKKKSRQESETMRNIIIGTVGGAAVIIIFILLGITFYLIRKQRNREVVVVYKPDGRTAPGSESQYAIPYYESVQPNIPGTPRPSPVLRDDYSLPKDSGATEIREPMYADTTPGTSDEYSVANENINTLNVCPIYINRRP